MWPFSKKVRTRFAPSPTGFLHVGGLRTALYNYLFAKQRGGEFIVRIEDTDKSREVPGAVEKLLSSLDQFGLKHDKGPHLQNGEVVDDAPKGPYIQSHRLALYRHYAEQLIARGSAYRCFCTPERLTEVREAQIAAKMPTGYDGFCRNMSAEEVNTKLNQGIPSVIRQKIQHGRTVTFTDFVHGEITFSTDTIDDQVLLKSDGYPTYHLANVVDDHTMEITHVIRGEEWLPSTPKHILIFEAFGWELPVYAHLPLLLSPDRKKLSKRQGDVAVDDFISKGYLKDALLNFVALLGWNPGEGSEQELFTLKELIRTFDLSRVHKAGAVFDITKLDWINSVYLRKMDLDKIVAGIAPFIRNAHPNAPDECIKKIAEVERERIQKFSDISESAGMYFAAETYPSELLVWKKSTKESARDHVSAVRDYIKTLESDVFQSISTLEQSITRWITEKGYSKGEVLWPLRVALTGKEKSPSPFEVAYVVGPGETVRRIDAALEKLV